MTFADAYKVLAKEWRKDPLKFAKFMWPDVEFYNKQRDVIYSIRDSMETYVVAGHELGKDFVAGFIALSFFLLPQMYFSSEYVAAQRSHEVKVVTTSLEEKHLKVLWGEIGRFINQARIPLTVEKGGPLIFNHMEIRRVEKGMKDEFSYLIGMVAKDTQKFAGHHASYNMFVGDECSSIDDDVYQKVDTWAKRKLLIGNPYDCENFFRKAIKEGNVLTPDYQNTSR